MRDGTGYTRISFTAGGETFGRRWVPERLLADFVPVAVATESPKSGTTAIEICAAGLAVRVVPGVDLAFLADVLGVVKTATDDDRDCDTQLQVYADAACREGLQVRAAYVDDLGAGVRRKVDVSKPSLERAEGEVVSLVDCLKAPEFRPCPGPACPGCDVRQLCRFAKS